MSASFSEVRMLILWKPAVSFGQLSLAETTPGCTAPRPGLSSNFAPIVEDPYCITIGDAPGPVCVAQALRKEMGGLSAARFAVSILSRQVLLPRSDPGNLRPIADYF